MSKQADEIAALRAENAELWKEVDKLKALTPTPIDPNAAAKWADEMREMAERRASAYPFSRKQLAVFAEAADDATCRGIVRDNRAPMGPSSAGTSGTVSKVSSNPGLPGSNTSGWRESTPLGPQPGINHVDRLMDEQDRKDRADAERAEAVRRAALGRK